jgi:uncharacterized membrane protein YfcA
MNPITALLAALGALSVAFVGLWARAVATARRTRRGAPQVDPATDARFPTPLQTAVGAVTNFLDTLGIGSFATTTALFRASKMVPDRIIPGTLNAGHTVPTVVQALIYITAIPVDVLTLVSMIVAAVLGAWFGAGVVASWPKRKVQIGMGLALLAAATFFTMRNLDLFPKPELSSTQTISAGVAETTLPADLTARLFIPVKISARAADGTFVEIAQDQWFWRDGTIVLPPAQTAREIRVDSAPVGVRGTRLAVAVIGNLFLGALMSLGIGLYAPCMILVGLLGMSERTAFPIMMGSCAFLMPVGSLRFIKEQCYSLRAALGLALGGIPGVLVAAYIVKQLDLSTVRWLVIVVVVYTATTMLLSARSERAADTTALPKP